MTDRWCARGNHFSPIGMFALNGKGRPVRDCRNCARRVLTPMRGVDIDRIHYKLGAIRRGVEG
jgi:hypothetical protein